MGNCKYEQDEICVNDQCPLVADYCPVPDVAGVCRHEERGNMARWIKVKIAGMDTWVCPKCKTQGSPRWKCCPVCEEKMAL